MMSTNQGMMRPMGQPMMMGQGGMMGQPMMTTQPGMMMPTQY